nr:hypothetical protein [Tanacetum cinerariifolium]
MKSVKETVKIRVCNEGAWERVDGVSEHVPLNYVKRTPILPLLSSYSCLLEAISERLEIDDNSGFMVTYNSENDIVEDESSESDDKSSESDDKGSESDEDAETTPVENKNLKTDLRTFFLAVGAAIRTFMSNMRPLIIIDGAYLKDEFLGTMYLAVAMDSNNQILPLAYGVGKSETFRSWDWFLTKLKECIIDFEERFNTLRDWLPSASNKLDMIGHESGQEFTSLQWYFEHRQTA